MIEIDNLMTILAPILAILIPILAIKLKKYKDIISIADEYTSKLSKAINDGVFVESNGYDDKILSEHLELVGKTKHLKDSNTFVDMKVLEHRRRLSPATERAMRHKPNMNPKSLWYSTNIGKGDNGNAFKLTENEDIIVIISSVVRSYITASLRVLNDKGVVSRTIDIGQGSSNVPINIKLRNNDGSLLAKGKYELKITGDYGSSDSVSVTDKFEII